MPDREAVRRLKQGDIAVMELLIARYQVKAIRAAYFIVQDRALAEDVVQETFLALYQHIRQFDERMPLEPYLMRSVVNRALNATRRGKRETAFAEDGEKLETLLQSPTAEGAVEFREFCCSVRAAIAALPPRQRAAIVQRYYLEMNETEMSAALDAPPGTVKWLLHTAKIRLRALLGGDRSAQ